MSETPLSAGTAMPATLLFLLLIVSLLGSCVKKEERIYATPDYPTWKKTTDIVLDYPIPGHMDRFRIPRMNAI
ncbi:MAG: hypothetical protein ACLQMF_13845, partial [Rectinemataceae bacterium]